MFNGLFHSELKQRFSVCALSHTQAAETDNIPEWRVADGGSALSEYGWPCDGGLVLVELSFLVLAVFQWGGWAYLGYQGGLSLEINPAWPLPATHPDAHVSLDVIPLELQAPTKWTLRFLSKAKVYSRPNWDFFFKKNESEDNKFCCLGVKVWVEKKSQVRCWL